MSRERAETCKVPEAGIETVRARTAVRAIPLAAAITVGRRFHQGRLIRRSVLARGGEAKVLFIMEKG
jgi:hypothetical protein